MALATFFYPSFWKWKRLKALEARLKELEAVVAQFEQPAAPMSPEVRAAVIIAADNTLTAILVHVRAAIALGQRDKAVLLEAVRVPLFRVLALAPEAHMAEAHILVWSTFISGLIDKMLELEPAPVNGEDDLRGGARH